MAAALMLGASAVLVGTRFYATEEAAGFVQAKERICAASGDDTLRSVVFDISRRNVWPAPFTGRCLRNRHLDRWYGREIELLREQDSAATQYALARTAGDFDTAAVIAGESVGIIHEISTAREVVDGMMRTTLSLLSGSVPHVEVVTG
jgi:nitronate monooxygenase